MVAAAGRILTGSRYTFRVPMPCPDMWYQNLKHLPVPVVLSKDSDTKYALSPGFRGLLASIYMNVPAKIQ